MPTFVRLINAKWRGKETAGIHDPSNTDVANAIIGLTAKGRHHAKETQISGLDVIVSRGDK